MQQENGYMIFIVKQEGDTTIYDYVSDHDSKSTAESNIVAYKESTEYKHTDFIIIPF